MTNTECKIENPNTPNIHLGTAGRLLSVIALAFLSVSLCYAQPSPKVAYFSIHPPGVDPFWTKVTEVVEAAAEDLKIDLRVVYSKPNTYSVKKDGLAALDSPDRPDYFLTGYWTPSSKYHLQRAEELEIRTFIFNSGITSIEERIEIGEPRQKFKHWIGQLTSDEVQAGYTLADTLIAEAKKTGNTGKDGKVHLIAMGGYGDGLEEDRLNGLKKRVAEQDDSVLDEFILAGWTRKGAHESLLETMQKNSNVNVIWAMSDTMALGAIEAVQELGRNPGKDIFIGGMDWSPEAIEAIKAGTLTASMGGHFVDGAFALILIHDYHHKIDFTDHPGVKMQTRLQPITIHNIKRHLDRLSGLDWRKIDFRQFSKKYNSNLKDYIFSLDALLATLEPQP